MISLRLSRVAHRNGLSVRVQSLTLGKAALSRAESGGADLLQANNIFTLQAVAACRHACVEPSCVADADSVPSARPQFSTR